MTLKLTKVSEMSKDCEWPMLYSLVAKYDLRAMEFSRSVLNQRRSNRTPLATSVKPAKVRSNKAPWAISFLRLMRLSLTKFLRVS